MVGGGVSELRSRAWKAFLAQIKSGLRKKTVREEEREKERDDFNYFILDRSQCE